jgi:hypothetical protein
MNELIGEVLEALGELIGEAIIMEITKRLIFAAVPKCNRS